MIKTLFSAAFAFAMVATLAAPLRAADTLARLTPAKMAAMLTAAGAKEVEIAKPQNGIELVSFNDGSGTVNLLMNQCAPDGCEVLQMTILFDKDDTNPVALATINSYNAKVLNAQAALLPDGRLALIDLFVTNGGVTESNIMANLVIFLQAPKLLADHVSSENIASNAAPATVQPAGASPQVGVQSGFAMQSPRLKNLNLLDLLATRPGRKLR